MKYKNILIDNRNKIKLEKISFFMAENNSNKSMIIGGVIIAFLSIILLGFTITTQFKF